MALTNKSLSVAFVLLLTTMMVSCSTHKKITYFEDTPDSLYLKPQMLVGATFQEPIIRSNDILQISILTLDPQVNNVLTTANSSTFSIQPGSSNAPAAGASVTGFLVDNNGTVELPIVGKIKVEGLTTSAARDTIHNRVEVFYKNPVISVRFANFNVTVLGEVARPATYVVPSEKVSLLDAIGMAGDLTIYGKRENVLLIRDSSGVKQMIRFNLNSSSSLLSPYFYLKQGDIVYVEPGKNKVAAADAIKTRNITIVASGLSLLILLISRL